MKTALSAVALAAALVLAPLAGGTFAATDDSAPQQDRFTPQDRAAFLDARIAALKAGLELSAEQENELAAARIGDARSRQGSAPPASRPGGRGVRKATIRPPKSTLSTGSPARRRF